MYFVFLSASFCLQVESKREGRQLQLDSASHKSRKTSRRNNKEDPKRAPINCTRQDRAKTATYDAFFLQTPSTGTLHRSTGTLQLCWAVHGKAEFRGTYKVGLSCLDVFARCSRARRICSHLFARCSRTVFFEQKHPWCEHLANTFAPADLFASFLEMGPWRECFENHRKQPHILRTNGPAAFVLKVFADWGKVFAFVREEVADEGKVFAFVRELRFAQIIRKNDQCCAHLANKLVSERPRCQELWQGAAHNLSAASAAARRGSTPPSS